MTCGLLIVDDMDDTSISHDNAIYRDKCYCLLFGHDPILGCASMSIFIFNPPAHATVQSIFVFVFLNKKIQ